MQRLFPAGILAITGLLGGCGGAKGLVGAEAKVPLAPPGVYVEQDVAAGFAAYEERLARWGAWASDAEYGVHWCPREGAEGPDAAFHPYRSRGHWNGAVGSKPAFSTPPGGTYWVSDDSETWGDITMHHGWWIELDARETVLPHEWCWVPGLAETPARVVWRSGGGFVGWAPEPPSWIDDGDEGTFAFFSWTFEMMGSLFEPLIDAQRLEGDAQEIAANATSSHAFLAGPSVGRFARLGPNALHVGEARRALVAYASGHSELLALAPVVKATAGAASSPDSSSKASTSTTKKKENPDELPHAALMVPVMLRDPMLGPIGLTPRFLRLPDPVSASATLDASGGSWSAGATSDGAGSTTRAASWTEHAPAQSGGSIARSSTSWSTTPSSSSHTSSAHVSSGASSSSHSSSTSSHTSSTSSHTSSTSSTSSRSTSSSSRR